MSVTKVRPDAKVIYDYGCDGRDGHYDIDYSCPKCKKNILKKDIACQECGTFFDWSKKATIKIIPIIEWEV